MVKWMLKSFFERNPVVQEQVETGIAATRSDLSLKQWMCLLECYSMLAA